MTLRLRHTVFIAMLAAATPVAAQSVVPPVAIGQRVFVTNAEGFEFRGDVSAISSAAVEVMTAAGPKRIPMSDVWMISKKDSNKNGFWIGFAFGTLPIISLADGHLRTGPVLSFVAISGLMYGGIGALIDNAIEGREVLYRRPESAGAVVKIAPIVGLNGPKRVGLGGTIAWR